jgi:hypothetical protein
LHSIPIEDCDDNFFDSQDPAEYTGRASSCDDLTNDEFEDVDDELDPDVRLEDLLPWPPVLQFHLESLEGRRETGHDNRLMDIYRGKRHMNTTYTAEMQCGGSAPEEQRAEEGIQSEEAEDEGRAREEIDSVGQRRCEDGCENWHAHATHGWDGMPMHDGSMGMWLPGPELPPFGAGWSSTAVGGGSEPGMQSAGGPSSPPPQHATARPRVQRERARSPTQIHFEDDSNDSDEEEEMVDDPIDITWRYCDETWSK